MFLLGRRLFRFSSASFGTSSCARAHTNRPLELDPSLRALLKDVDISLKNHNLVAPAPARRELDVVSTITTSSPADLSEGDSDIDEYEGRKSPAAEFGSRRFGAVILPLEFQHAIDLLISESDKSQVHSDAKRLFHSEGDLWTSEYNNDYHSRLQASRHGKRDGYAFASVALPAHYSAILAVLQHVKNRLGPDWSVTRVIDWGAATGSALWAALHAFQKPLHDDISTQEDLKIRDSKISTYFAIDKREGLTTIAKRILRNVELGEVDIFWQKSFQETDKIGRAKGHDALAISAFILSSLNTAATRRALVEEIWKSGAHTMVIIDHGSAAGFEAVLEARKTLLQMGQSEIDDMEAANWNLRGCHIVAPCPHDAACPLHNREDKRPVVCAFPQRLQRPSFVRLTKHSGQGHEDIQYSYVVVRRGQRPVAADDRKVGRMGEVGKLALERNTLRQEMKELTVHDDRFTSDIPPISVINKSQPGEPASRSKLEAQLRQEAYDWPRLIFPPLKRSGHIILDGCTAEGKILRMTIPKSQGKQPFYDARKSSWGDIFPHAPKNTPQERYKTELRQDARKPVQLHKRKGSSKKDKLSYEAISTKIKEERKKTRLLRLRAAEMKTSSIV